MEWAILREVFLCHLDERFIKIANNIVLSHALCIAFSPRNVCFRLFFWLRCNKRHTASHYALQKWCNKTGTEKCKKSNDTTNTERHWVRHSVCHLQAGIGDIILLLFESAIHRPDDYFVFTFSPNALIFNVSGILQFNAVESSGKIFGWKQIESTNSLVNFQMIKQFIKLMFFVRFNFFFNLIFISSSTTTSLGLRCASR